MYSLIQLKTLVSSGGYPARSLPLRRGFVLIALVLACFVFLLQMQAAPEILPTPLPKYPNPDGCYPNFTTGEGCNALHALTSGLANSGLGWYSLFGDTTGSFNTGVGAGTLAINNGDENTASGAGALLLNTAGAANTANGAFTLIFNAGGDNSAFGDRALQNNTDGNSNSAGGSHALFNNTTGDCNVALGDSALLNSSSGDNNIAIGCDAGSSITTGSNNIYIANAGVDDESDTIRIGDPAIHQNAFIAGIPAGGLAAILFDFNSGGISIGVGGAVPFNQAPLIVGTAISKTDNMTFTLNKSGVYRVSYTLRTALVTLLGSVQVQVTGSGVGPTASLIIPGAPLSDQITFQANAGDTVQLVVGGSALTLAAGDNATINIDKIQ